MDSFVYLCRDKDALACILAFQKCPKLKLKTARNMSEVLMLWHGLLLVYSSWELDTPWKYILSRVHAFCVCMSNLKP